MSETLPKRNRYLPKSDVATVVSAIVIVGSLLSLTHELPHSEIVLGTALGFLFKGAVQSRGSA